VCARAFPPGRRIKAARSVARPFPPLCEQYSSTYLAQVTIPTDNVDPSFIRKPRRWDIKLIRHFMVIIGPISSVYDFVTFYLLLAVFRANAALFHTGWFVESLATQTLVLFIIRTAGNPLRSRPSAPLSFTTIIAVFVGLALPFTRWLRYWDLCRCHACILPSLPERPRPIYCLFRL
jgi:magnesium-transporting ATPase (P-type)